MLIGGYPSPGRRVTTLGYPFAAQVMLVAQCLRSTVGKTDGEGQRSPHSVLEELARVPSHGWRVADTHSRLISGFAASPNPEASQALDRFGITLS
jgi:hypothetical protein